MPKTHKLPSRPFSGHPASSPQPSRSAVESLQFILTSDLPAPRHKPKSRQKGRRKTIQNPPTVGAGVVAFFDGAFDRGRASFGAVVYREGQRIHRVAECVPTGPQLSCNVAEYAGAINVLRFFQREGITQGSIYGDSMLVVKQLNGLWKAKAGAYLPFYDEAIKLRRELPGVRLIWTNRENNTEADELSKSR
jgi:ribonuclease HI